MNASIEDLAWLAGTWQCEIWDGIFEEHWLAPKGGTMQGVGRHLHNGKTAFMEFMSIEPHNGVLTMYIIVGSPSHGHNNPVPFRLTQNTNDVAVFENPEHDFPSKIAYKRISADRIECVINGVRSGEPCCEVFNFLLQSDDEGPLRASAENSFA